MKTAADIRLSQNEGKRITIQREMLVFAKRVEESVDTFSKAGMHQVRVHVPERLHASLASIGLGYEKLGYRVRVEKEDGLLGRNLYRGPLVYLNLGW